MGTRDTLDLEKSKGVVSVREAYEPYSEGAPLTQHVGACDDGREEVCDVQDDAGSSWAHWV